MKPQTNLSPELRRKLLLKVISKPQPTREDVESVIELTAGKIVESLEAQSMTMYLIEGREIAFRHVYYSPSLWENAADPDAAREAFQKKEETLLQMRIPLDQGIVGQVIRTLEPVIYTASEDATGAMYNLAQSTGFEVSSMLTVPMAISGKAIGAIQVLNKEPDAAKPEFDQEDVDVVTEVAEYSAPLIQRTLDSKFSIDDQDTARFIARFTGNELVLGTEELPVDEKLLEVVGDAIIQREGIFPYTRLGPNAVAGLMANPLDYPKREAFENATELSLDEVRVAPASLIQSLVEEHFKTQRQEEKPAIEPSGDMSELQDMIGAEYGSKSGSEEGEEADFESEESAPIILLANRIIEDAYIGEASDIHIEPQENEVLVRYRVDGVCQEKLRLPANVAGALAARIKVMAQLDIAEKRLPQDGRVVFKHYTKKNIDIDLRVATAPMNFGEKIVMRILDKTKSALPITSLGFSEENLERYRECIRQPYGMILHCGPTGSGKSMTLFSALREVASPELNIQTAEDPIEYTIPDINQMQMKPKIGLTFARALRSYLRMDPDIILVGEIRDQETASIAVEAALTGHLLLSTLHTNDAPSTVARFTDMGIEPFMISSSLLVVCAQRLMRRVCKSCREPYTPEANEADILRRAIGWSGEIHRAQEGGCPKCNGIGMKGRVGIHELMQNNEELTKGINSGVETAELKRIAMASGMKTLHQDSMLKVQEGVSTMTESLSTVPPDMIGREEAAASSG